MSADNEKPKPKYTRGRSSARSGPFAAILFIAAGVITLEILSHTGRLQSFILPAPSAVLLSLIRNFDETLPHLIETAWI